MQSVTADAEVEEPVTTRMRLNELAEKWSPGEGFPSVEDAEEVVDLCRNLHENLGELIDTYASSTPLTREEARAWSLARYYDRRDCLLTDEAVAIALSALETLEHSTKGAETSSIDEWITPETVKELVESAESKYEQSEALLGTFRFPEREEVLDDPRHVWLDNRTLKRLERQAQEDEQYFDEVVNRLLDLTERRRTLEGLVREYLRARGRDNVAQVAIQEQMLDGGVIAITAHTGVQDALPDVVQETDTVTIAGEKYDFYFVEDSDGPHEFKRITVYASDSIPGMDGVSLDEGLVEARRAVEDVDRAPAVASDD